MAVNIGPLRKRPFRQKLKKDEEVSQGMCKRDQQGSMGRGQLACSRDIRFHQQMNKENVRYMYYIYMYIHTHTIWNTTQP